MFDRAIGYSCKSIRKGWSDEDDEHHLIKTKSPKLFYNLGLNLSQLTILNKT